MAKFLFTEAAIQDLTSIWEYTTSEWSNDQAEKYYQIILSGCNKIAQKPLLGKEYFEIPAGLYGQHISRHIIFYLLVDNSTVQIVRILHDSMDIKSKFHD